MNNIAKYGMIETCKSHRTHHIEASMWLMATKCYIEAVKAQNTTQTTNRKVYTIWCVCLQCKEHGANCNYKIECSRVQVHS